jgi:hypothetical protein
MKKLFIIVSILSIFSSCSDEPTTPTKTESASITKSDVIGQWRIKTMRVTDGVANTNGEKTHTYTETYTNVSGSLNLTDSAYTYIHSYDMVRTLTNIDDMTTSDTEENISLFIEGGLYDVSNDGRSIELTKSTGTGSSIIGTFSIDEFSSDNMTLSVDYNKAGTPFSASHTLIYTLEK